MYIYIICYKKYPVGTWKLTLVRVKEILGKNYFYLHTLSYLDVDSVN